MPYMAILFVHLTWFHSLDTVPQRIGWIFNEGVCKDGEGVERGACIGPTYWHLSSVLINGKDKFMFLKWTTS